MKNCPRDTNGDGDCGMPGCKQCHPENFPPKPPMVLYFRGNISTVYMDGSHMDNRFGHAFANRKRESEVGPYVHLDQFLAEVKRRAKAMVEKDAEENHMHLPAPAEDLKSFWTDEAIKQLTKEIEEGKA